MNGKLMLVDGNSILNRAFYGLQGRQLLATSDGLYTNAVFGFINIINKYLEEEQPDYICVAFDLKAPTFRHLKYEEYKAKRKGMPEELAVQVPVIKDVLDAMNIKRLEIEGYEADDILGSLSLCAEKEGMQVIIITGDRDALQLVSAHTRVKIPTSRGGKNLTDEYDYNTFVGEYGIQPEQFIDVKGLMGDQSDNIPGVPGIGEKTALSLIQQFGSIENLYERLDEVERKSIRQKLEDNKELAFMSKKLATIERNIPCISNMEDYRRKSFDNERLYNIFTRLEFKSLIEKFGLGNRKVAVSSLSNVERVKNLEGVKSVIEGISKAGSCSIFYLLEKVDNFSNKLVGMGLSWGEKNTYYVHFCDNIHEDEFLSEMKNILEDAAISKYGHDIKNLITYLRAKGIRLNGLSFDSMIAAYIIDPSRSTYTVSQLADEYLSVELEAIEHLSGKGKNYVPFSQIPVEKLSDAAGLHAVTIFNLKEKLDSIMEANGQKQLYYEIELPLIEVLSEMEYWGFKVNIDELKEYSYELEEKINTITEEIYSLAGEEFNINSPKQLGVILFERLGLPVIKKTRTGYSTDAEVLDQLSDRHEIVSKILEYRQLVKLKSTYVEGLLSVVNPSTGRIHSSFNQTVTATGRISSTEPNLQNIPVKLEMGRKIRKVFVAEDDNFILTDADYSQIELRILAHITGDENMIEAFRKNEDIHTTTASKVFGVSPDSVTPLMRSKAKAVNFGIVYGIGEFSLSRDLGISRKEAKSYIDGYLDKYPGVRQYMHDIVEQGKKNGYVTTIFNRRRYLPELKSNNYNIRAFGERIALNTPIQGSAADVIKIAMVKVYRALKERKMKSRLILQVHDELIVETYVDEKQAVEEILKECMENAVKLSVPLNIDIKSGKSWYETK
ncbi:MAG TPA: DNA polymerase I [Clostridiaceae bacterium]|nr:DNA polymerase I [Clostridiaceae bacterium]